MDTKTREQIEQGIESCKQVEKTFRGIRGFLEVAKACDDINMANEQLRALNKETQKARATVHDINQARQATKQ